MAQCRGLYPQPWYSGASPLSLRRKTTFLEPHLLFSEMIPNFNACKFSQQKYMMQNSKANRVNRWKDRFVDMVNIRTISQSQLLKSDKFYFYNYKNISNTGSIFACLPNNLILASQKSLHFAFLSLLETLQYSATLQPGLLTYEGDDTSLQHALYMLDDRYHTSFLAAAGTAATKTATILNDSPSMQEYHCCLRQGLTTTTLRAQRTSFFHCSHQI